MLDPYELRRFIDFIDAHDAGCAFQRALAELQAGRKTGHWMWFIFPQPAGLGHSAMSKTYAISGLPEAAAYLEHPVLGPRLIACTRAVSEHSGRKAQEIFGDVDAMKLRSSMTLFARAAPDQPLFRQVLDRCFDGVEDESADLHL